MLGLCRNLSKTFLGTALKFCKFLQEGNRDSKETVEDPSNELSFKSGILTDKKGKNSLSSTTIKERDFNSIPSIRHRRRHVCSSRIQRKSTRQAKTNTCKLKICLFICYNQGLFQAEIFITANMKPGSLYGSCAFNSKIFVYSEMKWTFPDKFYLSITLLKDGYWSSRIAETTNSL